MADQLNMGNLSLGPGHQDGQPPARSYIPPHMRGKGPMPGPAGPAGPAPGPVPGPGPMAAAAGLNQSAWAK